MIKKYDFFGLSRLYLHDKQLVERKEAWPCDDDDRMREERYHKSKTLYKHKLSIGLLERWNGGGELNMWSKGQVDVESTSKGDKAERKCQEFDLGKRWHVMIQWDWGCIVWLGGDKGQRIVYKKFTMFICSWV